MIRHFLLISLVFQSALLLFGCARSPVSSGGSGTDFPNTRTVIGALISSDGTPSPHSEVMLLQSTFNAVVDSVSSHVLEDTTDENGVYHFSITDTGEYTITAVQLENRTRAIVYGVHVDADTVLVDTAVMVKPGVIRVSLPEDINNVNGYVYVPGTTIETKINGDGHDIVLDSVPAGLLLQVNYGDYQDSKVKVIRYDVAVSSESTTEILYPSWNHARNIFFNTTSDGADISSTVVGFPVLIRLSPVNFNFTQAQKNGDDIRFTKSDGTPLPYEIETWDPKNSVAAIWVKVDTILANSDSQYITMYWGASIDLKSESNNNLVFDTTDGFQGVWHLSEPAGSSSIDATANGYNGTPRGNSIPESTAGIIGDAKTFTGANYIEMIGTAKSSLNFPQHGIYSLSAWVNIDSLAGEYQMIASKGDKQYNLQFKGATKNWQFTEYQDTVGWDETVSAAVNQSWVHLVGVRSGEKQYLYVNGTCVDSSIYNYPYFPSDTTYAEKHGFRDSTRNFMIGKKVDYNTWFLRGLIDEVRVSSKALSPDWIKLCYANQNPKDNLVIFRK